MNLTGLTKQEQADVSLSFLKAYVLGPIVVIALLALRSIAGISVDPLIALPLGGLVTIVVTGHAKNTVEFTEFGLSKVIGVSILLIGTGTIAGIIKASALQVDMIALLEAMNMPAFVLAPLSGILMGAATASTTAGSTTCVSNLLRSIDSSRRSSRICSSDDSRRGNGTRLTSTWFILPCDRRFCLHGD